MKTIQTIIILLLLFLVGGTTIRAGDTTRFIVTGDSRGSSSGINSTILSEMVQATISEHAEFILFVGDLVYGSSDSSRLQSELMQWRSVMQPLYDAGIGVFPVRGNHDAGNRNVWDIVFSGQYALPNNGPAGEENVTFSYTTKNILIVGVDEYMNTNRVNQSWIDSLFAGNSLPHVFVLGHAPAFKVRHTDCLDDYPGNRNTFWHSLANEQVKLYFCGHDHFYDHMRLDDGDADTTNDVHQIIVGAAGAPLRSDGSYNGNNGDWTPQRVHHEASYGYILVEVNDWEVTLTWKHRVSPGVYEPGGDTLSYTIVPDTCCSGVRGNVDGDPNDEVIITDLTYLVAYLFENGPPPVCIAEGNADGITGSAGPVDIADLSYLVAYLFQNGPAPVDC